MPNFLLSRATGFKAHDFDKAGASPAKGGESTSGQGQAAVEGGAGGGGEVQGQGKESKSIVDFGSQAKQDQLAELGLISSTTVKVCYYFPPISCHTCHTIP